MPLNRFLPLYRGAVEDLEKTLLKAEVQLFKEKLAKLFIDVQILAEIPTVLPALLSSLAGSSRPYNLTFDYTPICTSRIVGDDPKKVLSHVPPGKFLVIFDIDETLGSAKKDRNGKYVFSTRPMVPTLLYLLHKAGVTMAAWTAGARAHASGSLDIMDPNGYIKYVVHRPFDSSEIPVNWHPDNLVEYQDRKAFDLLPEGLAERAIIFDNSIKAIFHPSTRSRSVLVPDFSPPIGADGTCLTTDRFWLIGLIMILRAYAAFQACKVHVLNMASEISELVRAGVLSEYPVGGSSFFTVNEEYFPVLSDMAVQKVVATLSTSEVKPLVPTEEAEEKCMDVDVETASAAAPILLEAMCANRRRALRSYM